MNNKEVYYMLNKPVGVVSATKDAKDKTVIDLIDSPGRKEDLSCLSPGLYDSEKIVQCAE